MWWLGLALFLVCIIERGKIQDENNFSWFQIFTVRKSSLFPVSKAVFHRTIQCLS